MIKFFIKIYVHITMLTLKKNSYIINYWKISLYTTFINNLYNIFFVKENIFNKYNK